MVLKTILQEFKKKNFQKRIIEILKQFDWKYIYASSAIGVIEGFSPPSAQIGDS